jgi:hypothetical protein
MNEDRVESRIETLTDKQSEQFETRLEQRESELRDDLFERHRDTIKNQLIEDKEELNDFNVIVSGFQDRDRTPYRYIRTEPFIHENKKNLDLLIAAPGKGIAVLVEYERTLASGTDRKVGKFKQRKEFVETGGDEDVDADAYLAEVLNTSVDAVDYVLSSQHTPQDRLEAAAERKKISFCVWNLADHGVRCSIYYYPVKEHEEAPFKGHTDDELEEYIIDTLAARVPKQDYLAFTFSSSKYLKLKHMAFVLVTRYHNQGNELFRYEDWERLFAKQDIELNNYLDVEKRRLYRNFVDYGQACNVVELEDDQSDQLENGYRIKSSATTDGEKLEEELEEKMAKHHMAGDLKDELLELKWEILEEVASTGKTTLLDFVDVDDSG